MSDFSAFMKKNKKERKDVKFAVTKSLTDDNGKPLEWTIRPLSSKENDQLRESCTKEIPVNGNPNNLRRKLDTSLYLSKMLAASIKNPDLHDAQLQDSYGVRGEVDLLYAMVDDPGEYADLVAFIEKLNHFDQTLSDEVEEAKN